MTAMARGGNRVLNQRREQPARDAPGPVFPTVIYRASVTARFPYSTGSQS